MAVGFFNKLWGFVKNIGSTVLHAFDKAKEIGAKALIKSMPTVEKVPIIGSVVKAFEPAIKYTADNKGKTLFTPPLEFGAKKLFGYK